jgi:hypothetical protein
MGRWLCEEIAIREPGQSLPAFEHTVSGSAEFGLRHRSGDLIGNHLCNNFSLSVCEKHLPSEVSLAYRASSDLEY